MSSCEIVHLKHHFEHDEGSKKVPSVCAGVVDFPAKQVTLHAHMPNGQGAQASCHPTKK